MLTVDLRGSKKKVADVLEENSVEFSRSIITSICDAIDRGAARVTCLIILTDIEEFAFTASRSFYEDALKVNIETMITVEEYEVCAKAARYIKKLQIKLLENSK